MPRATTRLRGTWSRRSSRCDSRQARMHPRIIRRTAMTVGPAAGPAERLLAEEETWGRRALTRASLAWWTASLSGKAADYRRMESADRTVNRHYARPAAYQR